MRLKVTDCNFTLNTNWLFKLTDESNLLTAYMMDKAFYKLHHIKSPVTFPMLDCLDKNSIVNAEVINIENQNIVVRIIDYIV